MRLLLAILVTLPVACSLVHADLLDDAIQAHRAGIPEVSITKLRQFLANQPTPARAETARILLARCLIETQKMEEAAQVLAQCDRSGSDFFEGARGFALQAIQRSR